MNKKDLIDYCKTLKEDKNRFINCIDVDRIINTIKQLDEPQKVTIPKFVADYIEFKKKYNFHVYGAMRTIEDYEDKRVPNWFYEGNIEKFCLACILGYEIEKEKKFFVKIKCLSEEYKYLNYFKSCREWLFSENEETKEYRTAHTRKELEEAGFGWVFDCEGVEVEEVD